MQERTLLVHRFLDRTDAYTRIDGFRHPVEVVDLAGRAGLARQPDGLGFVRFAENVVVLNRLERDLADGSRPGALGLDQAGAFEPRRASITGIGSSRTAARSLAARRFPGPELAAGDLVEQPLVDDVHQGRLTRIGERLRGLYLRP